MINIVQEIKKSLETDIYLGCFKLESGGKIFLFLHIFLDRFFLIFRYFHRSACVYELIYLHAS